jgi:hypothetical protein
MGPFSWTFTRAKCHMIFIEYNWTRNNAVRPKAKL